MNLRSTFFICAMLMYASSDVAAQCGATVAVTPGADCSSPSTLKLTAGYNVARIDWQLNNTSVKVYDATWEEYGTIMAGGNGKGSGALTALNTPSVVFAYRDTVWVGEWSGQRVMKWNPGATSGTVAAGTGTSGATLKTINLPSGIFRDKHGNIFVSEYDNARVTKWLPGATEGIVVAGRFPVSAGPELIKLNKPTEIYLDDNDTLYVVEQENARVTKWAPGDTTGVVVAGITKDRSKTDFTKLYQPLGLGADASGNLYISDDNKVLRWDKGSTMGVLVAGTGVAGTDAASFTGALSVKVDKLGNMYVSDQSNHRIQRWLRGATTGETIIGGRGAGTLPTYATNITWGPRGLHLDSNGNIFISEWNGHRVTKFRPAITDTFLAAVSGTYRVIISGFNGCVDTVTVNVTGAGTAPVPVVTASGPLTFCEGDSVTLTASAGKGVTFRWKKGNDVISGATKVSLVVKTAGSYVVEVISGLCATPSAATTVKVNPLPDVKVSPADASVCKGKSTTLTASGAATYSWSPATGLSGTTGASVTSGPQSTVTYTITGKDANNCENTATKTVTVLSLPVVTVTAASASVCPGEGTVLTAGGASSYTWSPAAGLSGTTGSVVTASPASTQTYLVTGLAANGCSDTVSRRITVHTLPVAVITPNSTVDLCEGDSVLLDAGAWAAYQWQKDGSALGIVSGAFKSGSAGSYKVVVTDANHCSDTSDAVDIILHAKPSVTVTPGDTAFCAGGQLVLNAVSPDTGLSYQWKNAGGNIRNAVSDFYQVLSSGKYSVAVSRTQIQNCTDSSVPVTVEIYPLPRPTITWDSVMLRTESGHAAYQWSLGGQDIPGATDPDWTPVEKGNYQVTVTDTNGCSASATFDLTSLGMESVAMANAVRIYPNPARSMLYIQSPVPVHVRISNIEGRALLSGRNIAALDVTELPAGFYLVVISDGEGRMIKTEKLLKATE